MTGRRKHGRGRLLFDDKKQHEESELLEDGQLLDWNQDEPSRCDDSGIKDENTDFVVFGIDGHPWRRVIEIWTISTHCRFVRVPNRSKRTLNAVINRYVESGRYIVTDMWKGYNGRDDLGYHHDRKNHKENKVEPSTGAHANENEGAWNILNAPHKRNRGSRKHLKSFLDEVAWRMMRKEAEEQGSLFDAFIEDIRTVDSMNL